MTKPEQVKVEVTTKTVTHTVVSGKWHFYTSNEIKPAPSGQPAPKGK